MSITIDKSKSGRKRELLQSLSIEKLKVIKMAIIRPNLPAPKNPLPLDRGLGDPTLLTIHFHGKYQKILFDRDDIEVNSTEPEEIYTCSPNPTGLFAGFTLDDCSCGCSEAPPKEDDTRMVIKICSPTQNDSGSPDKSRNRHKSPSKKSTRSPSESSSERNRSPPQKSREYRQRRNSRSSSRSSSPKRQSTSHQHVNYVPGKRSRSPYLQQEKYISKRRPREEHNKTPELRKRGRSRSTFRRSRSYSPKLKPGSYRPRKRS